MNYASHQLQDTIVALATPPGVGAIGVIRLSGREAIAISDRLFRGKALSQQASHTVHFGSIQRPDGSLVDEVLVSLFVAPRSYTRENVVEISCHGSPYILQQLIELCIEEGARMAQPGEFTLRAFLNGQLDLSQAEAVADLIASNSESAHRIALRQMRGGVSQEIAKLREELINFASLIELELDFGEEDVEFANRDDLTGDFSDTSRQGFQTALDISAYSLVNLAQQAKPLMNEGGSIVTLTYLGGVRVVPNYNVMGIAKAALEMNVRYLAAELGPSNIRVNGISAGPIRTLASSAVGGILDMIHHVEAVAPLRRTVTQAEVGNAATFLCSDLASGVTGQILYVDSGYEIMGM